MCVCVLCCVCVCVVCVCGGGVVCVCVCACVCVCVPRKRFFGNCHHHHQTWHGITASDMVMHHMLIILTLTFIHGHTDLNHENNKCSIMSEIVPVMPIKFAVK